MSSQKTLTMPKAPNSNGRLKKTPWLGIIVALLLIVGGIVLVWVIYRKGLRESDEGGTTSGSPSSTPTKPDSGHPTTKDPDPVPKLDPSQETPTVPLDPAKKWPWVGQSFVLSAFYTERSNVQYRLQTSWISEQSIPHRRIRLTFFPVLTYIDWNNILSGKDGVKHLFLIGGPKEGLLNLIDYETVKGRLSWKSQTKIIDDDGKSFQVSLGSANTEEEGLTLVLQIRYMSFGVDDRGPKNPILDIQNIVFETDVLAPDLSLPK